MADKRVFYVGIPIFKHKVLKCAGQVGDADHEAFYRKHFQERGWWDKPEQGPYKVIVAPFQGDRVIDPDDLPDAKEMAFILQQIGERPILQK